MCKTELISVNAKVDTFSPRTFWQSGSSLKKCKVGNLQFRPVLKRGQTWKNSRDSTRLFLFWRKPDLELKNQTCRKYRQFGSASGGGIPYRTQVFVLGTHSDFISEVVFCANAKSKLGRGFIHTD